MRLSRGAARFVEGNVSRAPDAQKLQLNATHMFNRVFVFFAEGIDFSSAGRSSAGGMLMSLRGRC